MEQFADVVQIIEINCDAVPAAYLSKTGIYGVPTVVLTYDNNSTLREISRFHGPKSKQQFGEWLEENIKKDEAILNAN